MTTSSHTELDAILILDAMKSIVEAKLPADALPVEPEDVSEYLTDIARIVQKSAKISDEQLEQDGLTDRMRRAPHPGPEKFRRVCH
ncbi:hypothetical protein R3Q06_18955 [Rhodococcus erythropolis]|uniref:hypothetical protein n=1 Tax=Rhodococcus erythropolis TaxID=1833 RepID=UPI002948CE72|nr:hypothetical protein [Rhodococcus erythropolis]MDV6275580.1 hypothetical protein [Rhodococcus erythropolis]